MYSWAWANPLPAGDYFNAIAYGTATGVYVAVGGDGNLYHSTNGSTWTTENSGFGVGVNLLDVIFAGDQFVASAKSYSSSGSANSYTLTSPDGVTWTASTVPFQTSQDQSASYLSYGNSTYVMVGNVAATSTDGKSWTEHTIGNLNPATSGINFYISIFGENSANPNGVFVILGYDQNSLVQVYSSTNNGSTWTADTIAFPSASNDLFSIAWNGSVFVAGGQDSSSGCTSTAHLCGMVFTSTDGISWTQQPDIPTVIGFFDPIIWNGSSFVTDALLTTNNADTVFTSSNGSSWTAGSTITGNYGGGGTVLADHSTIWTGNQFASVPDFINVPTALTIQTSTDFTSWSTTSLATGFQDNLTDVIYADNQYVTTSAGGNLNGADEILTSPDGQNWTTQVVDNNNFGFNSVAWNGTLFVAVGDEIATSPDGIHWTVGDSGTALNDVAWGDNKFVAVGSPGVIETSLDGVTWSPQTAGTNDDLTSVAWSGTQFVAVTNVAQGGTGSDGIYILTSPDGIIWTPAALTAPANTTYAFTRVRLFGSTLYAVGGAYPGYPTITGGASPIVATSPDGINWSVTQPTNLSAYGSISDIAYNGSDYFASLPSGLYHSTDASTWNPAANAPDDDFITALAAHGSQVLAVGQGGGIVFGNIVPPPTATNGSVTTIEGTAVIGALSASGSGTLTFAIATQPGHGTVTLTNASTGAFTYTSASGFTGTDSFTFTADNVGGVSSPATETVTVNPPAPTASNGSVATVEGTAVNGTLSATGSGSLTFTIAGQPGHGTVTLTNASTGAFTYTPTSGYSGTDTFTFTASNAGGTSAAATETITVTASSTGGGSGGGTGGSSGGGGSGGGGLGILGLLALAGLSLTRRANKHD